MMEYLLTKVRSFDECKNDKPGTIYFDEIIDGFRCLVVRGPAALCGYVGVPEGHELYGKNYENMSIECHWGLTFSNNGDDKYFPAGWWFFGWDYAHSGDAVFYDFSSGGDFKWCVEYVVQDVADVVRQFAEQDGES